MAEREMFAFLRSTWN